MTETNKSYEPADQPQRQEAIRFEPPQVPAAPAAPVLPPVPEVPPPTPRYPAAQSSAAQNAAMQNPAAQDLAAQNPFAQNPIAQQPAPQYPAAGQQPAAQYPNAPQYGAANQYGANPPQYGAAPPGYPPNAPYGNYGPYNAYNSGPYGYGYPQGYYAQPPGTSGLAIASLILGICGFFCVTPFISIGLGIAALSKIGKTGGSGKGMAAAGIILSSLWILLLILLVATGGFHVGSNSNNPGPSVVQTQGPDGTTA